MLKAAAAIKSKIVSTYFVVITLFISSFKSLESPRPGEESGNQTEREVNLTEEEIETLLALRRKSRKKTAVETVTTSAADLEKMKKQKDLIARLEKSIRIQKTGFQHEIHGTTIQIFISIYYHLMMYCSPYTCMYVCLKSLNDFVYRKDHIKYVCTDSQLQSFRAKSRVGALQSRKEEGGG
jgi:hypothetical protein